MAIGKLIVGIIVSGVVVVVVLSAIGSTIREREARLAASIPSLGEGDSGTVACFDASDAETIWRANHPSMEGLEALNRSHMDDLNGGAAMRLLDNRCVLLPAHTPYEVIQTGWPAKIRIKTTAGTFSLWSYL